MQAVADGDVATVLRLARKAAGLTQADVGRVVGYSISTVSRMETRHRRVSDVHDLRLLAAALDIPVGMLGLTSPPGSGQTARTTNPTTGSSSSHPGPGAGHRTGPEAGTAAEPGWTSQEDEDRMRRRALLTGLVAAPLTAHGLPGGTQPPAAAAALDGQAEASGDAGARLLVAVRDAVLRPASPTTGAGVFGSGDPEQIVALARRELAACMRAFQASEYALLARRLPPLLHAAAALPGTSAADAVRAEIHNTATCVMIKLEVPGIGWMSADRAMTAARSSGDPAIIASCTRSIVSLCRREQHYDDAQDLALRAVEQLHTTGTHPDPAHLSLAGMLLGNAAYAAAHAGDRSRSVELLDLAGEAAARLGGNRNEHWTAFGPTNVTLHRISAAYALGDAGAALDHARTVRHGDLRLPERRARFWVDVARAQHLAGAPDLSLRALLIAERQAPQEVHARPAVRTLTRSLLHAPGRPPGLRELAHRVGAA